MTILSWEPAVWCGIRFRDDKKGKRCLVIDKRNHIGGNIYTEDVDGIQVHKYGAHIFHTSDTEVWKYVNKLTDFNNYINSPVAVYKDELYNLPFNMNTFSRLWNLRTPKEVQAKIQEQIADLHITEPKNLEEQALSLVGKDVYEKLIKGYTEKQWGETVRSFRLLSSGGFHCVLLIITITLTTDIREFRSAAIRRWWRSCWKM